MKEYRIFLLLVAFVCQYYAQDPTTTPPEWNGDPTVCTPETSAPNPNDPPYPRFSNKAEFTIERIEIINGPTDTRLSVLTLVQYLYDYDANKLITITNDNGFVDVEFYYYERGLKSVYYRRDFCTVLPIPANVEIDGSSSTTLQNGTTHIRPLNEFLLFSSNDPRKPTIRPKYIGKNRVRGVLVNQWETCIVDKTIRRTIRRFWSFADNTATLPAGTVGDNAVPMQAVINASIVFPNGTQLIDIDEIFNVHSYRPFILESNDELAPPKGVFCNSGKDQVLTTLPDIGIVWPERFSVRVEASTSRGGRWQRFFLRYDSGGRRGERRVRYDYLPPGSEDYRSIIHDYSQNLTYNIDLRTGGCKISRTVAFPDVSPTRDPIEFFIKYEAGIIFNRPAQIWEFNGYRSCRGDSIKCTIVTASIPKFPAVVDPDTGKPTGEIWEATNIEQAWSFRAPLARPPTPTSPKTFDYPAHLYLKLFRYRDPSNPSGLDVHTENVEYEFYEMSQEINPYDFDVSTCYRANSYDYLHLGFQMNSNVSGVVDGNHLNRRLLELEVHFVLSRQMNIKYARISGLELDHERNGNRVTVFFTLLGPTPDPSSATGVATDEPSVQDAKNSLEASINSGSFQFPITLTDNATVGVQFIGRNGSLSNSKQFMSIHATGVQIINKSYKTSAQNIAICLGLLIGLVAGVVLVGVIRIVRGEPMPALPGLPTSIGNPVPNISFHNKKSPEPIKATSDA